MVSTQEAADLLNLQYLETQPLLDTASSYQEDGERNTSQFETEGTQRLKDRMSELEADIEDLRAICHGIHEQLEDAIKRHERIQGELQDEIHDNTRETRQQVTGYVERTIHQHMESFISQMEHKDTTFRIVILKTLHRQRNLIFLLFALAILICAGSFFLGWR